MVVIGDIRNPNPFLQVPQKLQRFILTDSLVFKGLKH